MVALIQIIWRWLQLLGITLIYAAVFGILVAGGDWLFGSYLPTVMSASRVAYLNDLFSEFFGMVMIVVIVDRLNAHRMQRELAEELLVQAGSRSNAFALYAIDRLRAEHWLTGRGGRLRRANLSGANLQGANLSGANLRRVNLTDASLRDADLSYADLGQAVLSNADLAGARLTGTRFPPDYHLPAQYQLVNGPRATKPNDRIASRKPRWDS